MGLYPGGGAFKPQLTVQLNPALRTPGYYGRTVFFCPWGKKSPYVFSKFDPRYTDTGLLTMDF